MGRPSLKQERTEEIITAYETCVARYGIDGATLERVAEEAGLARPLIRHNVGNREDLLNALIDRFFEQSADRLQAMTGDLPKKAPVHALIDVLFADSSRDHNSILIAEALIAAAAKRPALAARMQDWLNDYVSALAGVLKNQSPNAPEDDIRAVAAGLTGIYFNVDSLIMLGPMPGFKAESKRAALLLLAALDQ